MAFNLIIDNIMKYNKNTNITETIKEIAIVKNHHQINLSDAFKNIFWLLCCGYFISIVVLFCEIFNIMNNNIFLIF